MSDEDCRTVYTACAWWYEVDTAPFACIVATDTIVAHNVMHRLVREEAERAVEYGEGVNDRFSSVEDVEDQIHWSGVRGECINDLDLTEDQKADLEREGWILRATVRGGW